MILFRFVCSISRNSDTDISYLRSDDIVRIVILSLQFEIEKKTHALTIFFQMGPSLFSGAENTLGTKRQVQDKPIKAAEPVLLL